VFFVSNEKRLFYDFKKILELNIQTHYFLRDVLEGENHFP